MNEKRFDVTAIGNAIVDVLAQADDALLTEHNLAKGAMSLIDATDAERLYKIMGPGVEASGGSAANTIAGIAALGGRTAYIGKVADDQLGDVFTHDIRAVGAVSHCLLTEDHHRLCAQTVGAVKTPSLQQRNTHHSEEIG